jgi:hypothetical protein
MVSARVLALLGFGWFSTCTSVAQAEPHADARAQAQALFDTARAQMAAERFDEACANFQRSIALVDGVGTRFNLADCLERSGKLGLSLRLFTDVAVRTRQAGDLRRAELADERVKQLEARLSDEDPPAAEATKGVAVSLAASAHVTEPSEPAAATVQAPGVDEGESAAVAEDAALGARSNPRKTVMLALGGASVIGLVGGTAMGFQYLASRRDAGDVCSGRVDCTEADVARYEDLVSDMRAERDLALVGFGVGTAALLGTLYLYLTQPNETPEAGASVRVEPLIEPGSLFGGSVRGSF